MLLIGNGKSACVKRSQKLLYHGQTVSYHSVIAGLPANSPEAAEAGGDLFCRLTQNRCNCGGHIPPPSFPEKWTNGLHQVFQGIRIERLELMSAHWSSKDPERVSTLSDIEQGNVLLPPHNLRAPSAWHAPNRSVVLKPKHTDTPDNKSARC